jgi:hypothetical protein
VGNLLTTSGGALVVMAAFSSLTRIIIVWLALQGTRPRDRPAILRAVASLLTARQIELHALRRRTR